MSSTPCLSVSAKAQTLALARYAAVSWVQTQQTHGCSLHQALYQASQQLWEGRRFAFATLERYLYRYRREGFGSLQSRPRADRGQFKAISAETCERLVSLRRAHPRLGVSTLIARLVEQGVLEAGRFSRASVYRVLARHGLDRRSVKASGAILDAGVAGPTKAFEMPLPNLLWMTDYMHGVSVRTPASSVIQTRLFAILDDCTRLCPHGQYYAEQNTGCFLDVLRQAVSRRGLPDKLYSDNDRIYTGHHTRIVCANLDIRLIHARPYAAWSKGKIERFFRTVQEEFQQQLVFAPVHSLEELNTRFWQWLEGVYHQRVHHSLGMSPAECFSQRAASLRPAPTPEELQRLLLHRLTRRVRKDATISLDGRHWEVPVSLRGQMVELHYDPRATHPPQVFWQGKFIAGAKILDKHLNAKTFSLSSQYDSHRA